MDLGIYITAFVGFASALTCVVGVVKGIDYLKSKSPITELNNRVNLLEKKVEVLEGDSTSRGTQASSLAESVNLLGLAMSSMINHMIDNNGIEELKKEREKLNAYFYKRD